MTHHRKRQFFLLSSTALLSTLILSGTGDEAAAACTPDPATDGDTVVCTGTDTDGFTSTALDLSLSVDIGATVDAVDGNVIDITGSSIVNAGTISGTGAGEMISVIGLKSGVGNIDNSGTIDVSVGGLGTSALSHPTATGILAGNQSPSVTLFSVTNTSAINANSTGAFGNAIGVDSLGNYAVINSGTVVAQAGGDDSVAIGVNDAENGSQNSGTVSARITSGINATAYGLVLDGDNSADPASVATTLNLGTIEVELDGRESFGAAVWLKSGSISFRNEGQILASSSMPGNTLIGIDGQLFATSSGVLITNTGNISVTSAGLDSTAIGIRAVSEAAVTNSSTISVSAIAPNSDAIGVSLSGLSTATTSFTNTGSVVVNGSNSSTGVLLDGDALTGLNVSLINMGTIDAQGLNATAVRAVSAGSIVNEAGATIQSTGIGVHLGQDIQVSGASVSFINHGSVIAVGSAFMLDTLEIVNFQNDGLLRSTGENADEAVTINATASTNPLTLDNLVGGTIEATGVNSAGVGIHSIDGMSVTLNNWGTISGMSFAVGGESGSETVNNFGTLTGTVALGAGNDVLANSGSITGNVNLGAGDDVATSSGSGTLVGNLNFGDGFDTLTMSGGSVGPAITGDITNLEVLRINGSASDFEISGNVDTDVLDVFSGSLTLSGGMWNVGNVQMGGATAQPNTLIIGADATLKVTGQITGTAEQSFPTILWNKGSLNGDIAFGDSFEGEWFFNDGTMNGLILMGGGDDIISNTGSIFGDLDGGAGFDTLTNDLGGSIVGAIANFESLSNSGSLNVKNGGDIFSLGGDLTLAGTSELKIQLESGGPVPIQIAGAATLAGALEVDFSFSSDVEVLPGDRFTVLTAGGGVTGSFASLDLGSRSFLGGSLIQTATGVEIELVRSSFLLPFFDAGKRAIASELDAVAAQGVQGQAGAFIQALTFTDRALAGPIIDQLSTRAAADVATPVIEARHGFLSELSGEAGRLASLRGLEGRWVTSVSGYGEFGESAGLDYATGGAMAVSAYGVSDRLTVGFAMAGTASDLEIETQTGDNGHTALDIAAFSGWQSGNLLLTGALGASYNQTDTERSVLMAGFEGRANGSAKGAGYSAAIDGRYDISIGNTHIVPQAAVRVAGFHHGAYDETELGNLGLRVDGRTLTSARASAGLALRHAFETPGGFSVVPEIGAYYEREFGDRSRDASASFIADPTGSFPIIGRRIDAERLRASGGFTARFSDKFSANVRYEGAFGQTYDIHRVVGGLRFNW